MLKQCPPTVDEKGNIHLWLEGGLIKRLYELSNPKYNPKGNFPVKLEIKKNKIYLNDKPVP